MYLNKLMNFVLKQLDQTLFFLVVRNSNVRILGLFAYGTSRSAVGLGITLCTFTPCIASFGHLVIWPFGHLAIWSFYHFDILTFRDRG
jgi:hypothetical protein